MAKIDSRYARALFEISDNTGTLEKDLDDALWIKDVLGANDIQSFLLNPGISDSRKNSLIQRAFSDKVNKHMMGLLHLMIRKSHESYIIAALSEFIEVAKRHFGKTKARLVSATPLTSDQIESVGKLLTEKLGMQPEIATEVDPDIIGGFYIIVNGKIFDNTIRTRLNNMKKRFYKGDVVARVVSARPLTDDQISSIYALLKRKFNTEVKINAVVDPDLIGGFYVVADGYFFDSSIRTSLREMKKNLKRGKL